MKVARLEGEAAMVVKMSRVPHAALKFQPPRAMEVRSPGWVTFRAFTAWYRVSSFHCATHSKERGRGGMEGGKARG